MATMLENKTEDEAVTASGGQVFSHHTEAVLGHRETYGPPGLRGLFPNCYVVKCAAFLCGYLADKASRKYTIPVAWYISSSQLARLCRLQRWPMHMLTDAQLIGGLGVSNAVDGRAALHF